MLKNTKKNLALASLLTACIAITPMAIVATAAVAQAATAAELNADSAKALQELYAGNESARAIGEKAKAILVFPKIIKAGLMIGGQAGEGVMRKGGKVVGYYNSVAASYGLQAGIQTFGYVMFMMTDSSVAYLNKSSGWEIGVGPTVVVVDAGMAKAMTTTTLKDDVYAFFFDQTGLMAGLGVQGSKITKIDK